MRYKAALMVSLVCCLSHTTVRGEGDPPGPDPSGNAIDWQDVSFEPLGGTTAGISVRAIVGAFSRNNENPYLQTYHEGEMRKCMLMILEGLTEVEANLPQDQLETTPGEFMEYRSHSGFLWSFWRDLALVGRSAAEFGHPELLGDEARRLLEEMETAFSPLMRPDTSGDSPARGE